MEHFLFIRTIFWMALLVFTIVLALIFLVIEKVRAKVKLQKRKRDLYGAAADVLTEQYGLSDQLTA